jgi:hypothetical protein
MEDHDKGASRIVWDLRREGRGWTDDEFDARVERLLELKLEVSAGKLFWEEDTRRMVLAMLLENVGLDAAVRLGDPSRWREALAALGEEP